MKILCGVDFSEPAHIAARGAARLAAKFGGELRLVHVAQLPGIPTAGSTGSGSPAREEFQRRAKLLHELSRELSDLGAQVVEELVEGVPDEELLRLAREHQVDLVVVAPIGDRRPTLWSLGGVAMRVVKGASAPTLVVREDSSLEAWTRKGRRLRILLGVDSHTPLAAPTALIERLAKSAPVEVIAGQVYPRGQRGDSPQDRYERELSAGLVRRVGSLVGKSPRTHVLAGWGRVAEHMLEIAALEAVDLIVVGAHQRAGVDRLLHGSVSLDLIGASARNVLAVPITPSAARRKSSRREFRRVLVPVDMSELSERAIHEATSLLGKGGVLQLLHVCAPFMPAALDYGALTMVPPPSPEEDARVKADIERRLRALAAEAEAEGLEVHVEAVSAFNPTEQICAAAERLESDAICISTHGRSGLSKLVLGSVAEGVIRLANVPVLVVPPHAH